MTKLARELIAAGVPDYIVDLRRMRADKGLTLTAVAGLVGMTVWRLQRLERYELGEGGKPPGERAIASAANDAARVRAALEIHVTIAALAPRMADFRQRLSLLPAEAARMAGVSRKAWDYAEQDLHRFGPRPEVRAKIESLLKRWEGRTSRVGNTNGADDGEVGNRAAAR